MNSSRAISLFSLALGIALALALIAIADAILFRPLPVPRPDEIVRVFSASPLHSMGFVSYPDYRDFARSTRTLNGLSAQTQILAAFGGRAGEPPSIHMGLAVTPNYFEVLGVPAHWGRTFRPDEGHQPVVVLSDSLWRRRFAGDHGVIGRTVPISGTPFTVIGVARAGFGLDRFLHEDFYVPVEVYAENLLPSTGRPLEDRSRRYLSLYGRRRGTLAAVQVELASIAGHLASEYSDTNRNQKVVVMTELAARMAAAGTMQTVAWGLLALAALSLIVACCNAGGLLLLAKEARSAELALKVALGASPFRLFREAAMEALAITSAGGAAAIPCTWAALKAAAHLWMLPTDLPLALDARIDPRMMMAAAGAVLSATVLCAIAPGAVVRRISSARTTAGSHRLLNTLVITELALATALAGSGASLFAGMKAARNADLGYRTDHVLLITFDPSQIRAGESRTRAFYRDLLEDTARLPDVRGAVLAQSVPLGFTAAQKQVKATTIGPDPLSLWMNTVTPGYFDLMRIPLTAGRDFSITDTERSPAVAIVNEAAARLWPEGRALGRKLEMEGRAVEIIGVAKTVKYQQAGESAKPFLYLPYAQNFTARMTLHAWTRAAPAAAAPSVIAAAREIDPSQPVAEIRPFDESLWQGALFGTRIGVSVMAVAGSCAWLMSLTGLYVCAAHSVARRRREIGIRCALGATRESITYLVMKRSLRLTATGVVSGAMLAAAACRWATQAAAAGVLQIQALVLASAVIAVTSLTACFLPVWRASCVDPVIPLREQP